MSLFPFTREGRQTLIYLVLAGSGPALTIIIVWAMWTIRNWGGATAWMRLDKFATLAYLIGAALLVIVIALACFVSIRAIKIGKDGISATGDDGDGPAAAKEVAEAAQEKANEIQDNANGVQP